MKILTNCFMIVVFAVTLQNCKNLNFDIITVKIDNIDTSGVYFKYSCHDSIYYGFFSLSISEETFYINDSLKIRINKKNPTIIDFIEIVKYEWGNEKEVVFINNLYEGREIFGYHQVDLKPIIFGAKSEFENDSIIAKLLFEDFEKDETFIKIGVFIIIDQTGCVNYYKAFCKNDNQLKEVIEQIDKLPKFVPAIHKGDTVSVKFLIEVPVTN